jgi:hypothetical protein
MDAACPVGMDAEVVSLASFPSFMLFLVLEIRKLRRFIHANRMKPLRRRQN